MQAKSEEVKVLQEKVREANRVASALRCEKKTFMEATDLLQTTNNQLKANIGGYWLLKFNCRFDFSSITLCKLFVKPVILSFLFTKNTLLIF